MKNKTLLMALCAFVPLMMAGKAEAAQRYCREYTKSVRIDGRLQSAYGTACLQPDGSWQVVSFNGHDDLFDDIARASSRGNGRVVFVENRPASYWYRPYARPYYRPHPYPASFFGLYWNDGDHRDRGHNRHDRGGRGGYKNNRHHEKNKGHHRRD